MSDTNKKGKNSPRFQELKATFTQVAEETGGTFSAEPGMGGEEFTYQQIKIYSWLIEKVAKPMSKIFRDKSEPKAYKQLSDALFESLYINYSYRNALICMQSRSHPPWDEDQDTFPVHLKCSIKPTRGFMFHLGRRNRFTNDSDVNTFRGFPAYVGLFVPEEYLEDIEERAKLPYNVAMENTELKQLYSARTNDKTIAESYINDNPVQELLFQISKVHALNIDCKLEHETSLLHLFFVVQCNSYDSLLAAIKLTNASVDNLTENAVIH
jgi:hypothetical protein